MVTGTNNRVYRRTVEHCVPKPWPIPLSRLVMSPEASCFTSQRLCGDDAVESLRQLGRRRQCKPARLQQLPPLALSALLRR